MKLAVYAISAPLIAESVFAPLNLWRGRTVANWIRFTGLSAPSARMVAAPVKLLAALLLIAGLIWRPLDLVAAAAVLAIALFYLFRLGHPARRAADGIVAFTVFGALAAALLAVQLLR